MRRYDDPVDVRKGRVPGAGGAPVEGPEQFVWKGRLWKVHAVLGDDGPDPMGSTGSTRTAVGTDLELEREVWRVEAARGMTVDLGRGVFDLVFDWADGSWRLTRCLD
jgi:hypothetical protein